jgi:hypothetical protein
MPPPQTILGWEVSIPDNDSYMLGDETEKVVDPILRKSYDWRFMLKGRPHPATCQRCGRKTDGDYLNPQFRVKKRRHSLSITYDGYVVASKVFQEICISAGYPGVEFIELPSDPEFAVIRVHNIVAFDPVGRGTRLENLCSACGRHSVVVGATPVFLKGVRSPLKDGFYRTDLEFGCTHGQHPLLILGASTVDYLRSKKLRGIALERIIAPE